MQIDPSTRLVDYKGEPIKEGDKEAELRTVLINSLNQFDPKTPPQQRMRAFILSQEIMKATGPVDIKAEDIVYIKEQMLNMYGPMIYGQVMKLLGE